MGLHMDVDMDLDVRIRLLTGILITEGMARNFSGVIDVPYSA